MSIKSGIIRLFLGLLVISPLIHPQESADGRSENEAAAVRTIPDTLRRPERGEAPRYPQDLVIGELGRGSAPDAAYRFAGALLTALAAGTKNAPALAESDSVLAKSLLEELKDLGPRSYRLGGGRIEADGSVSFMVRFLGAEESVTGELYLRRRGGPEITEPEEKEEAWLLDDLVLEEKKALGEANDSYRYDFSPYERFY